MAILFTGKRRLLIRLFTIIYRIVRVLYPKPKIQGLRKISRNAPAVFVANHLGSYGPVTVMPYLPFPLYPWVTHEITDLRQCAEYIERDFIYPELRLKPPLSTALSKFIGWICVALMRYMQAIPVYKGSRKVAKSLDMSICYLLDGRDILIFPEIPNQELNSIIRKFDTGFINIAKEMFREYNIFVQFYPVAVNRDRREIKLGNSIEYDPSNNFSEEKQRIVQELEERICEMV